MEDKKRILVADDSPEIIELLELLLSEEGYQVITATNGEEAIQKTNENIDLIILDVMMPEIDGYDACQIIREKTTAPILFLTAKGQEEDKELGLSLGADDYIAKPFSYLELIARVKALIRRYYIYKGKENFVENKIVYKNLTIDCKMQNVSVDGKQVMLTATEYNILLLLLKDRKKVFSAEALYEKIWNEQYYYNANNTIMVHILKLRKKIEKDYKNPEIIKTSWGKGYYID